VQTFYRASKYEKKDKFISILNEDGRNAKERTLVFVEARGKQTSSASTFAKRTFQQQASTGTGFKVKESRH